MRLTKIYTRSGDSGNTRLADGTKVAKTDSRLEAYGNVDELNSFVGLLCDEIRLDSKLKFLLLWLTTIQHELFDIGGELATPNIPNSSTTRFLVQDQAIERLETEIDDMNQDLADLKNFVLPGGDRANSMAHVCRTVCRRTERSLVLLQENTSIRSEPLKYINRLSDWFFVAGRKISQLRGAEEVLWNQKS